MNGTISARVTLYVDVHDAEATWDHALAAYRCTDPYADIVEFIPMCGTREEPDLAGCLRMIFNPGDNPPGLWIQDSSAELD